MNITPTGFLSYALSETGNGQNFQASDYNTTFPDYLIVGGNLWGDAYGTAEANNNDAAEAIMNGSASSFIRSDDPYQGTYHFQDTNSTNRRGELHVEVNPYHEYWGLVYAKSVNATTQSKAYLGFVSQDVNGNFVDLRNCGGYSNDTLSADLNDGDTYIYVSNINNWSNTNIAAHFRLTIIFPCNHSTWFRPHYHTRLGYGSPTRHYSEKDTANSRLRISSNGNTDGSGDTTWSSGFIPAGTPISRGVAGGTYNYCMASNNTIPYTYTKYSNPINSLQYPYRNSGCAFRPGTRSIRTMGLYNRASGAQMYMDNYFLTNITDQGQTAAGDSTTRGANYLRDYNFGPQFKSDGLVNCSNINEIVPPGHGGVFSYGNSIYKSSNLKLEIDTEEASSRGNLQTTSSAGIYVGASSTWQDLSGNSNDMTIEGNPFAGYGTQKQDGSGDRCYRSSLSWSGKFTFGVWMYVASGQDNNGKYWFTESYRGSGGCFRINSSIVNGSGSNDVVRFAGWDNSASTAAFAVDTTSPINDGVWHYIVAVWDNITDTKRIYFDGRLEGTVSAPNTGDGNYQHLHVGGSYGCLGDTSVIGHIGPFHFYTNEVLTDDQIYHNYNYFWQSRYRWLSDSTIKSNVNKSFGGISF
ncbi:LamG domain-containing protein [Verrucomicrobia bacterium]|nr:LamG domain-containing protein [Verrucomicrobiota bacterium]MDB4795680.1 LamG domain-containing protein [Verrucomicrobiota bacterium]MDC0318018.1 LamG domain-containing protein [bacterium]